MDEREATQIVSELYESLYSPLLRYLTHSSGDLEVSEEVVQETFTRLYQQLRRGRRVENPKAWAFCVARREMSRRAREAGMLGIRAPIENVDELAAPSFSPVNPAGADDVTRLMGLLSAREAEVLHLRLGNMKYREIGGELGISVKAVGTLLGRALGKLRQALTANTQGGSTRAYVEAQSPKTLQ